jgi:EpsI family protein
VPYFRLFSLLFAFAILFHQALLKILKGLIFTSPTGILIFAMSIALTWWQRDALRKSPVSPNMALGAPLTGVGCFLFICGEYSATSLVQNVSVIVVLFGLVWLILGNRYLKILSLPLGYLLFMFGFFEELLGNVSIYLQEMSARIASTLLTLTGMPVLLSKQFIELPHITLEVARECSGIHHIVALVAVAIPLGYMTQRSWLRKVALVFMAFFIGIFANGLRVALIGLWTKYRPGGPLHGPWEVFYATFIFIFGMFLLVFISGLIWRPRRKDGGSDATDSSSEDMKAPRSARTNAPVLVAVVILLTAFGFSVSYSPVPADLKTPLESFPTAIGPWRSQGMTSAPPLFFDQVHADSVLRRDYEDPSGHRIELYIAYFAKQYPDKKIINDVYTFTGLQADVLPFPLGEDVVGVKRAVFSDKNVLRVLYYWYDVNGRILTDRYGTKLSHVIDAFTKRRTNASLVIVSSDDHAGSGVGGSSAGKTERRFIQDLLPVARIFLNNV